MQNKNAKQSQQPAPDATAQTAETVVAAQPAAEKHAERNAKTDERKRDPVMVERLIRLRCDEKGWRYNPRSGGVIMTPDAATTAAVKGDEVVQFLLKIYSLPIGSL